MVCCSFKDWLWKPCLELLLNIDVVGLWQFFDCYRDTVNIVVVYICHYYLTCCCCCWSITRFFICLHIRPMVNHSFYKWFHPNDLTRYFYSYNFNRTLSWQCQFFCCFYDICCELVYRWLVVVVCFLRCLRCVYILWSAVRSVHHSHEFCFTWCSFCESLLLVVC